MSDKELGENYDRFMGRAYSTGIRWTNGGKLWVDGYCRRRR